MNIGLLSRQPDAYSNRRLIEACEARGHTVRVIDALKCAICISCARPRVHHRGEPVMGLDAIIPRIGASITPYGLAVLRQFEVMGVYPLNEAGAIGRSRDKLRCMQDLAAAGVPLPTTAFTRSAGLTRELIEMVDGPPIIVKLLHGTHGRGVVLVDAEQEAESVIEAFHALEADFLVQRYVSEAKGRDLRCFVIGDRVAGAMLREGKEGDFRSNIHHGGHGEAVELTPEEESVAVRAARALGLNVAGVDLLRSDQGPVAMEVNSSPGFEGLETTTGRAVAEEIVAYIERTVGRGEGRAAGG